MFWEERIWFQLNWIVFIHILIINGFFWQLFLLFAKFEYTLIFFGHFFPIIVDHEQILLITIVLFNFHRFLCFLQKRAIYQLSLFEICIRFFNCINSNCICMLLNDLLYLILLFVHSFNNLTFLFFVDKALNFQFFLPFFLCLLNLFTDCLSLFVGLDETLSRGKNLLIQLF